MESQNQESSDLQSSPPVDLSQGEELGDDADTQSEQEQYEGGAGGHPFSMYDEYGDEDEEFEDDDPNPLPDQDEDESDSDGDETSDSQTPNPSTMPQELESTMRSEDSGRKRRNEDSWGTSARPDNALLDDMVVAKQYAEMQLHLNPFRPSATHASETHRSQCPEEGRVKTQSISSISTSVSGHKSWLESLSVDASSRSQVGGSRFALLLQARLSLIGIEIRTMRPQAASQPGSGSSQAEVANRSGELAPGVRMGLKSFFLALKSLCKERHHLLVEICRSICETLEGLPVLALAGQELTLLDSIQGVLHELVEAKEAEPEEQSLALRAHMTLALLRGSVKCVLESALLAVQSSPTLKVEVHRHLQALSPSPSAHKALHPLSDRNFQLRKWGVKDLKNCQDYAALASDREHLYLHTKDGLYKLASGYGGLGQAGEILLHSPYRKGHTGWLAFAAGKLYFRQYNDPKGHEWIYELEPENLQAETPIQITLSTNSPICGPLVSDGKHLYIVSQAEHYRVDCFDPTATQVAQQSPSTTNPSSPATSSNRLSLSEGLETECLESLGPEAVGESSDATNGSVTEGTRLLCSTRSVRLAGPAKGLNGRGAVQCLDCDVLACGQNRKGELGHSNSKEQLLPSLVQGARRQRVLKIAAGNETSYFLTEEGKLLCCGLNGSGQLGRATRIEHTSDLEPIEGLPPDVKIVEVSCYNGAEHVSLITSQGRVFSAGCNAYGQLGVEHVRRSNVPLPVEPLLHVKVVSVACSYHHSVAVTENGEAYAYGLNDHGQLGIGSSRHHSSPKKVVIPNAARVTAAACGQHHTMLLCAGGALYSCGRNHNGQLGLGTKTSIDSPKRVEGFQGHTILQVACGYTHTCAITPTGLVYTFGQNHQGQLGHGTTESVFIPKIVEGLRGHKALRVSCGAHHTCVLTDTPRVWAFGSNCHGQLGQGDTVERTAPVPVTGLDGKQVTDIACGFHHMIALTADTSVPALDERSLTPQGALLYTDGSTLYAHLHPLASETEQIRESGRAATAVMSENVAFDHQASRICRGFSLDTGVNLSDNPSALAVAHSAAAYDPNLDVIWAWHDSQQNTANNEDPHVSQETVELPGLELYGNIGAEVPAVLVEGEGSKMSDFPFVPEAFLSLPEHMVSEEQSTHDARTSALILLANLDLISRSKASSSSSAPHQNQSAQSACLGGSATAPPAKWRSWSVDLRPETFELACQVLEYCVQNIKERAVQHFAVFTLRLLRVNIVELGRLDISEDEDLKACALLMPKLLERVQELIKNAELSVTPIHYESCRVIIDGLQTFFPKGQDRVALLLHLLGRYGDESQMPAGDRLLTKLLLEAISSSKEVAASLIPSKGDFCAAEAASSARVQELNAHCESFRELLLALVSILDRPLISTPPPPMVLDVTMMLIRGLVGASMEDQTGPIFVSCMQPLVAHVLTTARESARTCLQGVTSTPPYLDQVSDDAEDISVQDNQFLSCLLPWVITACFMFVKETRFAQMLMRNSTLLAECLAEQRAATEADFDGMSEDTSAETSTENVVVESSHPYEPSERKVYHVRLPGASFLTVEFDTSCDLGDGDYVQVFSDELCRQAVSLQLSGSTLRAPTAPVLLIVGESCSITFESSPSSTGKSWGFRCMVCGHRSDSVSSSWWTYLIRSSLGLAAKCASSLFSCQELLDIAESRESAVDEQALRILDQGVAEGYVDLLESSDWNREELMSALSKQVEETNPVGFAILMRQENSDAEAIMKCLRPSHSKDQAENTMLRTQYLERAKEIVFACLLSITGKVSSRNEQELHNLWSVAEGLGTWVSFTQQSVKGRLIQVAEDEGMVGAIEQELSHRAFKEVLSGLQDRAMLVMTAKAKGGDTTATRQLQLEQETIGLLKSSQDAVQVLQELRRRRQILVSRKLAMNGFQAVLESAGADDGIRSDTLRLLCQQLQDSTLHRMPLCETGLHKEMCEAFCMVVMSACSWLSKEPFSGKLMAAGNRTEARGAGDALRRSFLSLVAKQPLPLEFATVDVENVLHVVWGMCTPPVVGRGTQHGSSMSLKEGDMYDMAVDGILEFGSDRFVGKFWCPIKVKSVNSDTSVVIEVCAGPSAGESRNVNSDCLRTIKEPTLSASPGDAVLVRVSDCLSVREGHPEAQSLWLNGVVDSVSGEQANVQLKVGDESSMKRVHLAVKRLFPSQPPRVVPSVTVSRDLAPKAHVTVSSAANSAEKVLDGSLDTYWQSSGSRPHWLNFMLPKVARIQGVLLYINYFRDRSFTPKHVTVKIGPNAEELRQLSEFQVRQGADGWTNVLQSNATGQEGQCVRITICDNQDSGCNSRIRAVKLVASWAEADNDASSLVNGDHLLESSAQASLRLIAATIFSRADERQEVSGDVDGTQARAKSSSLEKTCLDYVWRCFGRVVEDFEHGLQDASACADWIDFLLSASKTSSLIKYLDSRSSHTVLLTVLESGSTAMQLKIMRLYKSVLPRLTVCMHRDLVESMLELAGKALALPASPLSLESSPMVHWAVGADCVYLIRTLYHMKGWAEVVKSVLHEILDQSDDLDKILENPKKLIATLCVFGGLVDGLRLGAAVCKARSDVEDAGIYGYVAEYTGDSAVVTIKIGPDEVTQRVRTSMIKVVDAISPVTDTEFLPKLIQVLRKSHSPHISAVQAATDSLPVTVQHLKCLALRSVVACVKSEEAAEICFSAGLLGELLDLTLAGENSKPHFGVEPEHVFGALMDRAYCLSHGDQIVSFEKEGRIESETMSPSETRSEEARARDTQREAMAADLMALGYGLRLCTVALQLNGDDPQAAASWLLDSSSAYLENHPELEEPEEIGQPDRAADSAESATEDGDPVCQAYFAERSNEGLSSENSAKVFVGSLRADDVHIGQMIEVVGSSTTSRTLDPILGRCGVVTAVDREFKTVSIRWSTMSSQSHTPIVTPVPISALGKLDHRTLKTLGFAMSLSSAEFISAMKKLLCGLYSSALSSAVATMTKFGARLGDVIKSGECSVQDDSNSENIRPMARDQMYNLLRVVACAEMRAEDSSSAGSTVRNNLRQGLACMLTAWHGTEDGNMKGEMDIGPDGIGPKVLSDIVRELAKDMQNCDNTEWSVVEESVHPLPGGSSDTPRAVRLPGAEDQPVAILFDARSHLVSGQRLLFYLDSECTEFVASFSGKGYSSFSPLILPTNSLWVKIVGGQNQGSETCWGYRFALSAVTVKPLLTLEWTLNSFLDSSTIQVSDLCKVFRALWHHLSSFTLPCPLRINICRNMIRALHRLCKEKRHNTESEAAEEKDILQGLVKDVMEFASNELQNRHKKEASNGHQPTVMLQSVAELVSACSVATACGDIGISFSKEYLDQEILGGGEFSRFSAEVQNEESQQVKSFLEQNKLLPKRQVGLKLFPEKGLQIEEAIQIASSMLDSLIRGEPFGSACDAVICEAFLADRTQFVIREGNHHPYVRGTEERGVVEFPGAQKLHVVMDARSATDGDDYLSFYISEDETVKVASYSGKFGTGGAGPDVRLVVEGDRLWYSFVGKKASNWGYRFIVRPEYPPERRAAALASKADDLQSLVTAMQSCDNSSDGQLLHIVNGSCEIGGLGSLASPTDKLLNSSGDVAGMNLPPSLSLLPLPVLRLRLAVLQIFNNVFGSAILPVLDLRLMYASGSLSNVFFSKRNLICMDVKAAFIDNVLQINSSDQDKPIVVVDRRSPKPVFEQLKAQAGRLPAQKLWHVDMAFLVQFLGEGAEGYNGPYRECISTVCGELESTKLPLLIPCPNSVVGGTTPNQDCYIPRPSSTSPNELAMFEMLGRLMGIAIWTHVPLDLHFPPMIWRKLVNQTVDPSELAQVDTYAYRALRELQEEGAGKISREMFLDRIPGSFEVVLSDGTVEQLFEGGKDIPVTWENRKEYSRLATLARVNEAAEQIKAIQRGMEGMVPKGLLHMLDGAELEKLVTGTQEIDITLLKEHTVCKGEDGKEVVIEAFWDVLAEFSQHDLAAFLRFVWGRSRLPRPSEFTETFKIHLSSRGDHRLPKADTCFFTLNLPAYSTKEVLRERMVYAIHHCMDMDADMLEASIPPSPNPPP